MSLKPIVRGPVSMVVSSWKPTRAALGDDRRVVDGERRGVDPGADVMLPVSCSAVGLPRST